MFFWFTSNWLLPLSYRLNKWQLHLSRCSDPNLGVATDSFSSFAQIVPFIRVLWPLPEHASYPASDHVSAHVLQSFPAGSPAPLFSSLPFVFQRESKCDFKWKFYPTPPLLGLHRAHHCAQSKTPSLHPGPQSTTFPTRIQPVILLFAPATVLNHLTFTLALWLAQWWLHLAGKLRSLRNWLVIWISLQCPFLVALFVYLYNQSCVVCLLTFIRFNHWKLNLLRVRIQADLLATDCTGLRIMLGAQ